MQTLTSLVYGVILGILLSLLFKGCSTSSTHSSGVQTTITHTTDTVYLPQKAIYTVKVVPRLVYTRPGVIYLPGGQSVPDTVYKHFPKDSLVAFLAHREYRDTLTLAKGLKVGYRALTTGKLDSLSLGVVDTRPTKIIKDSVTLTSLPIKKGGQLFVGGQVSPLAISPGLVYTRGNKAYSINYNLFQPNSLPFERVTLGLHFLLLGK